MTNQENLTNQNTSQNTPDINLNTKDFDFIIKRSKQSPIIQVKNNPVKQIKYIYTRDDKYSEEIINYITKIVDKQNQFKYENSLLPNQSNFHLRNFNFNEKIDVLFEYETIKNDVHSLTKAFNVHEHRKIPYEEEMRNRNRRRNFRYSNDYNNYYNKKNKYSEDKNKDKIIIGRFNEFKYKKGKSMNKKFKEEEEDEDDKSHYNTRKTYNSSLTSYDPFKNKKTKAFREDDLDDL